MLLGINRRNYTDGSSLIRFYFHICSVMQMPKQVTCVIELFKSRPEPFASKLRVSLINFIPFTIGNEENSGEHFRLLLAKTD